MNGILNNTSVYLSGPIECVENGADWRLAITPQLEELGIRVFDPLVKPSWIPDINGEKQASQKKILANATEEQYIEIFNINYEIRKMGVRLAHASDWIICRLPKQRTFGTIEELTIAKNAGKPCLFWCPEGMPSMWIFSMFANKRKNSVEEKFYKKWEDLFEYIKSIDSGQTKIDPYEWIFTTYKRETK